MSGQDELTVIAVARRVMGSLRNGGDEAAAVDALHPEVDWYGSVGGLEPGLARGREEVLAALEGYRSTWAELSFEEEAAVVRGDRALILLRESGRGLGSGATVERASAGVLTVQDGQVTHVVSYVDRARALADFGVPEAEAGRIEAGATYALRDGRLVTLPATG